VFVPIKQRLKKPYTFPKKRNGRLAAPAMACGMFEAVISVDIYRGFAPGPNQTGCKIFLSSKKSRTIFGNG
jgi:hypothetical protein